MDIKVSDRKRKKRIILFALMILLPGMLGYGILAQDSFNSFLLTPDPSESEESSSETASGECLLENGGRKRPYRKETVTETQNGSFDLSNDHKPISSVSSDQSAASSQQTGQSEASETKGHWEYRDVLVSEAWDEQVLVKDGYMEKVTVSEAWDEEVTYCAIFGSTMVEMEVCNTCGAQFQGGINEHLSQSGHSGWHNEYIAIDEPHCQSYDSYFIHHDAVYQDVWHDPEYRTVHHDAVYQKEPYWVND